MTKKIEIFSIKMNRLWKYAPLILNFLEAIEENNVDEEVYELKELIRSISTVKNFILAVDLVNPNGTRITKVETWDTQLAKTSQS